MKIVESSVKCGGIILFDHKFIKKTTKFPSNFVPVVGVLSKEFVPWVGFCERKM